MKNFFTRNLCLILWYLLFICTEGYSQTLPDYIVTDVSVAPTTIISGVTQVYTFCKIKNQGYGNGPSGSTELRIFVNQDYTSTAGTGFGMTYYTEALAAGFSSDEISIENTITVPAGDYYFVFKVTMPESDDEESDATNNTSYVPVVILANMTVETDGNGTVSGLNTSGYAKDETVSLLAAPNEGYDFLSWTEGETVISTNSTLEFTASENRTLKANFAKKTFTVTVTSNPTEGGQNSSSTVYEYGTSVTLTANPNTNYYLTSWTVDGTSVSTSNSYTFTVVSNLDIVAHFQKVYTITLSTTGDGIGTLSGAGRYDENTSVTITATPGDNSSFAGWYNGSVLYSSESELTFTPTEDLTLTAQFDYITHLITLSVNNTNYGTIKVGDEYIGQSGDGYRIIHNTSCSVTAEPYNDQYTFKNWTENGTEVSTENPYSFTVTTDRDLYANFAIKKYTLTLEAGEGGTVTGGGSYNYNTSATMRATPGSNYYFVNWTNSAGSVVSTNATESVLMTADRSYKANFALVSYTITLSAGTGGTVSGGGSYEYGSTSVVKATANSGYVFLNWTESGTVVSTSSSYSFTVEGARTLKANFVKTYKITLQAGNGGSTSGGGTFNSGTTCTAVASPYYGYDFVNWTESGTAVSTSASYSFTVGSARTLLANFAIQTFSVTLETTTGGSVSGEGTYDYSASVTVTATPDEGYDFVSWTEDGTVVSTNASYTFYIYANKNLKANFAAKTYSVSLQTTTGGSVSGGGTYTYGTSVTAIAVPDESYDFVSWTENGTVVSTDASYTFIAGDNRTLTANFAIKSLSLTLEASAGGIVTGGGLYGPGTSVSVIATPDSNYDFVNWTENETVVSTDASYTIVMDASHTLKANFALKTFYVTLETSTGGSVTGQGIFEYGATATVTATPEAGYKFVNWTENGTAVSTSASYTFTVNADKTFKANFTQGTYVITLGSSEGGSVSGQGSYNYGASITVTAVPSSNYNFVSWTENGTVVSTDAAYTYTVESDRTLLANFTIVTFSIVLETTAGGTVTGQGTYDYASTATISAIPNTGYNFVYWTENGEVIATASSFSFMVHENRTLTAHFELQTYTVTLETSGAGSVSGQGTFGDGSNVTVTATPGTGYSFVNWTEDGIAVSTEADYSFTLTSNRSLIANFAVQSFQITAENSTGGTSTGSGIYNWGETATVTAIPEPGYYFVNWTENGTEVNTNSVYTFEVQASRNLLANFQVSTGISDLTDRTHTDCLLYPVPASDYVFLQSDALNGKTLDEITIDMYDVAGEKYSIEKVGINGNAVQCRLPEVREGLYFLSLNISDDVSITKNMVIINH